MSRPRATLRQSRGPGLELIVAMVLVLVAGGLFLRANPVKVGSGENVLHEAGAPVGTQGADVIVLLGETREARTAEQWNLDQVWLNSVEQEIGDYEVARASDLSRGSIESAAWLVIPRNAAAQLEASQIQEIASWVENGGVVIVEQPEGPWRPLIGLNLNRAAVRDCRRITSFDGSPSRGRAREHVISMPLRSTLMPYNPPSMARGRDYQVLAEADGHPAIVSIASGRGRTILVLFDLGAAVGTMQQGTPPSDFRADRPERLDAPRSLTVAGSLVSDEELQRVEVPWADLLERNLFYLAEGQRPVARLWNYPGDWRAAFISTHSAGDFGNGAEYMTSWEHENDVSATMFVVATKMSPEGLARISRRNGDIQLQHVPPASDDVPMRSWGVRQFRPAQRPMRLVEQRDRLVDDLRPYGPVTVSRNTNGLWPVDWFAGYRALEGRGITIDSSLGPAPAHIGSVPEQVGYIFGTGLPFRPIDRNGNRFGFYEMPYALSDGNPAYSSRWMRFMVTDAADVFHTTIVGDWRPDTMTTFPSYDAIGGWRYAFEHADGQDLWVTTFADYARFLDARQRSAIRSSFIDRRLTIDAQIAEVERDDQGEYIDAVPSVGFAARFRGRPVEHVWVDGTPIPVHDIFITGDRMLHVVKLDPGEHRIEVFYGTMLDSGRRSINQP